MESKAFLKSKHIITKLLRLFQTSSSIILFTYSWLEKPKLLFFFISCLFKCYNIINKTLILQKILYYISINIKHWPMVLWLHVLNCFQVGALFQRLQDNLMTFHLHKSDVTKLIIMVCTC